jgi:hypothetical protein
LDVADKWKRTNTLSNKFKILLVTIFSSLTWLLAFLIWFPFMWAITLTKISYDSYVCGTKWSDRTLITFFTLKFCFIFLLPYIVIIVSSVKLLLFLSQWKRNTKERRALNDSLTNSVVTSQKRNNSEPINHKSHVLALSKMKKLSLQIQKEFIMTKTSSTEMTPISNLTSPLYKKVKVI